MATSIVPSLMQDGIPTIFARRVASTPNFVIHGFTLLFRNIQIKHIMAPSNTLHRTGRTGGRYNLRGTAIHAPAATTPNQTARQCASDRIAKRGLKKSWPITRRSRATRGLSRVGNTCFMLSGLQALLHLPKFLNWILSHNTARFPCRPLWEVGKALAAKFMRWEAEALNVHACPACVVKRFVEEYWGPALCQQVAPYAPLAFAHGHPVMREIRALDRSLYALTSGAGNDAQQDPAEFQDRILVACWASTDDDLWRDQFDALFELEVSNPSAFPPPRRSQDPNQDPGSVDRSIHAKYADTTWSDHQDCTVCGRKRVRIERQSMNKVPEILRISLSPSMMNHFTGQAIFNPNPIAIPQKLDLSVYQDVPEPKAHLEYQLESVLSHSGTLHFGHWAASVNADTGIFSVNDDRVRERMRLVRSPASALKIKKKRSAAGVAKRKRKQTGPRMVKNWGSLRSNPQVIREWTTKDGSPIARENVMNAVILTYSRCATKRLLL
ncbi:hypothetical protein LEMA_P100140.1 [Plenodomus lingam JN3]|uniref:USP domain-containing protein n=1 Tax=Leptosphaeria maculans (strain JN3 / isolate v23.1.3 / race Av1-4-5-6-7-8) TaxID=985895 RepID=E5A023_LEPMJ|nr:hypothetical protein LEMA_P100140.1 [Plenodomus lingam JN3]CBX96883.1 hypothetical protein LEMA_P100140.1 [Plenodomus lingam JN3]